MDCRVKPGNDASLWLDMKASRINQKLRNSKSRIGLPVFLRVMPRISVTEKLHCAAFPKRARDRSQLPQHFLGRSLAGSGDGTNNGGSDARQFREPNS